MIYIASHVISYLVTGLGWLVVIGAFLLGPVGLAWSAEPGRGGGGMPQLDVSTFPSQIFWLIGHGLVLYFLLKRVALPRIEARLDQRRRRVEDALQRAEKVRDEAQLMAREHEALMEKSHEEALAIINEAKAEIVKLRDIQAEKTRKEIAGRLASVEENIAVARRQSEQIGLESVELLAAQLATRLSGLSIPSDSLRREALRHWRLPRRGH